ncbi:protein AF-10-like [Euwallacea similis]|uniref:protein AF-10-like n=1 Tax=Euwallacea similis TaxID=1736056 RepID=UPI00344E9720
MREMVGGCCVCSDDRGWPENPLVYCDGQSCNVAVHQACYGIVTVPTGPWYCCKCESQERPTKVKCELCPSRYGALKRTDNQGWAHVVCALYIPEVRFGNVSTMEPIQLHLIPPERFNKLCYICEEKGKPANATVGACMQCNRVGCRQQFHVTCAQSLGLLCEEAGNYLDNVKYCGYCQHHYSKLKKGGNVKTIPPYKPISDTHNSDSNSEKESESGSPLKGSPSQAVGKRRSAQGVKPNLVKPPIPNKSSVSQPKSGHSNNKGPSERRLAKTKSDDIQPSPSPSPDNKSDKKDIRSGDSVSESDKESKDKDPKIGKKRKGSSSRTATPIQTEISVVVSALPGSDLLGASNVVNTVAQTDRKNCVSVGDNSIDKLKKAKLENTQLIISNQPVVALTSISTTRITSSPTTSTTTTSSTASTIQTEAVSVGVPTSSIIQSTSQAQSLQHHTPHPSLVVSVPLASTSITPSQHLGVNAANSLVGTPFVVAATEKKSGVSTVAGRSTPAALPPDYSTMPSSSSNQSLAGPDRDGGLKITYENQLDSINTEVDMELEVDTPPSIQQVPVKRTRSQSNEKAERSSRAKKRNSIGNGLPQVQSSVSLPATMPKRSNRSQHSPPPPLVTTIQLQQPGAFAAVSQDKMKDSPPSSPSSEGQGASNDTGRSRTKNRKSAPAGINVIQGLSKDEKKEIKIFQNGIASAPHMLGNQLNPTSNMHQKMTDHLSNELEAHSIYSCDSAPNNLVGPQLHRRVLLSVRASSSGSSTASVGSGLSSVLGGISIPATFDQLLERQWDHGSQFLMEQAQHFDIASLLSCLHELRGENLRLEEHLSSLIQRRDQLMAINARLTVSLTGASATSATHSSHTVNNIHPNVSMGHSEGMSRSSRHSGGSYDRYPQGSLSVPVENGLPQDAYANNPHRDTMGSGQPSPNVRNSPAVAYSNNGLLRQCADTGARSTPSRQQPYPLYERPSSTHSASSQQVVIRRDRDQDIFNHSSHLS